MTARPVNRWRQTDWLLVVLSAAALLACLCYTLAYVFLVPYPGVTLNSGWMVISIDPRDDHPGWSVADRNSLQIGDQVLAIGDLTYEGYWSDRRCIPFDGYGSGDRVPITVQRNGQLQTMPWLMPAISQGNQAWRLVGLLFYLPFWLVG
ncbi:MAG: hypothetical protein KKA73_03195, partial [Chloroflexi bacterium]|nr:hypothetical protein [Chloroflexota bacterium]MBU1746670.1 hypothetical protein [Chloroflexota bacterium]